MKNKNAIIKTLFHKLKTNQGVAMVTSMMVIAALLTLASGFAVSTVNELNEARRYQNAASAFWLAEAGVNQFLQDTTLLDLGDVTESLAGGTLNISKQDLPAERIVTAVGTFDGNTRTVQLRFPAVPPSVFDNTISSGGDVTLNGGFAQMNVLDKTRITGSVYELGIGTTITFEDLQTSVDNSLTTLTYPDANGNSTPDEFGDFVKFNQDLLATYDPSEVVYIQQDADLIVTPNSGLSGKKILYVEGTAPNQGNVDIIFDASWEDNQNLTIISTGKITYLQPLQTSSTSQLNTISWGEYNEPSIFLSTHNGVTYSHDVADYFNLLSNSTTKGAVIANNGVTATEVIASKTFDYSDPLSNGYVPAGFEGLVGGGAGGYVTTPSQWEEI